jgi:hypothetical protein
MLCCILQEFADVLLPLLQPELPEVPPGVLQQLLTSAAHVQCQLPSKFVDAWAAAAAGSGLDSWSTADLAAATEQLVVQYRQQQQQQQGQEVLLPLEWASHALNQVSSRLQELPPQQQQQGEEADVLIELMAVLLAAAGKQLEHADWVWPAASFTHRYASISAAAAAALEPDRAVAVHIPAIYSNLTRLFTPNSGSQQQQQQQLELERAVLQAVVDLPGSQRTAAAQLLWSWLAADKAAHDIGSSSLLQLLDILPYGAAAAAYATAAARASSSSRAGAAAVDPSLLAVVLKLHAVGSSSSSSALPAVSGLLAAALQQDPPAAFAALPELLQMLSNSAQAAAADHPAARDGSDAPHYYQQQQQQVPDYGDASATDTVLMQLCDQLSTMLELNAEQLLPLAPAIATAMSSQTAVAGCSSQGLLAVLQLCSDLAQTAVSWQEALLEEPQQQQQGGVANDTAQRIAAACCGVAPAWVQRLFDVDAQPQQQQQQQQLSLPWLTELLDTTAQLHEMAAAHNSLAPSWHSSSSSSSSSDAAVWQPLESALLSAAAAEADSPLATSDILVAAAALFSLGLKPSQSLLDAYLDAVGPDALELSAEGLCQLLWILASIQQQQQQQGEDVAAAAAGTTGEALQVPELLQLAIKACSCLAVRSSRVTVRQLARATWAVAVLSSSSSSGSAGQGVAWSPPQQLLSRLQQRWEDASLAAAAAAGGYVSTAGSDNELLQPAMLQLQPGEQQELAWALQQLNLTGHATMAAVPASAPAEAAAADGVADAQPAAPPSSAAAAALDVEEPVAASRAAAAEAAATEAAAAQEQAETAAAAAAAPAAAPAAAAAALTAENEQAAAVGPAIEQVTADAIVEAPRAASAAAAAAVEEDLESPAAAAVLVHADEVIGPVASGTSAAAAAAAGGTSGTSGTAAAGTEAVGEVAAEAEVLHVVGPPADADAAAAADSQLQDTSDTADMQAAGREMPGAAAAAAAGEDATAAAAAGQAAQADTASASPTAAAAAAVAEDADMQGLPTHLRTVLQQLKDIHARKLSRKQAVKLLAIVQQQALQLATPDLLLFTKACLDYKFPVASGQLLSALQAAAVAAAATSKRSSGSPGFDLPVVLQLLTALAESSSSSSSDKEAGMSPAVAQRVPQMLQRLVPLLQQQQLAALQPEQLVQLLKDLHTLLLKTNSSSASGSSSSSRVQAAGASFFSDAALLHGSFAILEAAAPAAIGVVPTAWLATAAAALQPKLLLLPNGSLLLQSLQLLQALGLVSPGNAFLGSFFAATDALLDTFSGRSCLELLSAAATAGQLPSPSLTTALLQHLVPLRLSPEDVASGMRLLASMAIRPNPELLAHWFDITEAAADRLLPQQLQQILWACCRWQLQPPEQWLFVVLKGLVPSGRLGLASPATAAGICSCLWQMGVQPAPGVVTAIVDAAQHAMLSAAQQQHQQGGAHWWDAESLSVLCFCLYIWQHPVSPTWKAAVAAQAAVVLPAADGPSLLRLGMYLTQVFEVDPEQSELAEWQQQLLQAVEQQLPVSDASGEIVIGSSSSTNVRQDGQRIPAECLAVLQLAVLQQQPDIPASLQERFVAAVTAAAAAEQLTTWDVMALIAALHSLEVYVANEAAEEAAAAAEDSPLVQMRVGQRYQARMAAIHSDALELIKVAYQLREGAPAQTLATLPVAAEQFEIEIPEQSLCNLQQSMQAAEAREQQLKQALLLLQQGSQEIPASLLKGLDELGPEDGVSGAAMYADSVDNAAFWHRCRRLGLAVSDNWVLQGMEG